MGFGYIDFETVRKLQVWLHFLLFCENLNLAKDRTPYMWLRSCEIKILLHVPKLGLA